jgi:hypothetical protein
MGGTTPCSGPAEPSRWVDAAAAVTVVVVVDLTMVLPFCSSLARSGELSGN